MSRYSKTRRRYYTEHRAERLAYQSQYQKDNRIAVNKSHKKWRDSNPNKVKAIQRRCSLKSRHGITEEEYSSKLKKQHGRCAICKKRPSHKGRCSQRLVPDHCHKTGRNRGLLCVKCNTDVGLIENRPHLKKITDYLKKYDC